MTEYSEQRKRDSAPVVPSWLQSTVESGQDCSQIWRGLMQGESSSPAWPNPIMFQACRTSHITCLICLSATLQPCLRDLPHELFPGEPGILPIPVTAYHESWREEYTWGGGGEHCSLLSGSKREPQSKVVSYHAYLQVVKS